MNILYYDCFAGISGDMHLAALLELGVDKSFLIAELNKLNLSGWEIETKIDSRKGIFGTRLDVILTSNTKHQQGNSPIFQLPQTISAKPIEQQHPEHRGYKEIKKIIEDSSLSDSVKNRSLSIFLKIGEAEAKIHNKTIDEIHFHEVGAIDSIIDIVGAAICIDYLQPDKIMACPVQLGGGMVKCAHGLFPVPAPATTEILKGIPIKKGLVDYEATTPTGAAILATIVTEWTESPSFIIEKTAYGIGHKDGEIPNVLRVHWAQNNNSSEFLTDTVTIIECNIDDMNPEWYDHITNKLLQKGALDVYLSPITMKKMRPATLLSIICKPSEVQLFSQIILSETTTLGVRYYNTNRNMLQRKTETIDTQWGAVTIKIASSKNNIITYKPEYEDCLQIAQQQNIPLKTVYNEVLKILNK